MARALAQRGYVGNGLEQAAVEHRLAVVGGRRAADHRDRAADADGGEQLRAVAEVTEDAQRRVLGRDGEHAKLGPAGEALFRQWLADADDRLEEEPEVEYRAPAENPRGVDQLAS